MKMLNVWTDHPVHFISGKEIKRKFWCSSKVEDGVETIVYHRLYRIAIQEAKLILVVQLNIQTIYLFQLEYFQMISKITSTTGQEYTWNIVMALDIKALENSQYRIKALSFFSEEKTSKKYSLMSLIKTILYLLTRYNRLFWLDNLQVA